LGSPAWTRLAVALTSLALLAAFHHVVRAGVQQGETRRKAVAVRADAEWRCKVLRAPRALDCLLRLDSEPDDARLAVAAARDQTPQTMSSPSR
jgi:hypothetical protein